MAGHIPTSWTSGKSINACPGFSREGGKNPIYSYLYNYHTGVPALGGGKYYIGRLSQVKAPSQLLLITDASRQKYPLSGFSVLGLQENIGFPHEGLGMGLYADGHVESRSVIPDETIYPTK